MTAHVVFGILIALMHFSHLDPWKLGEGGEQMSQYVFADNLCRLCKERNISVNDLADAIGKSPRQINRYRNGQCKNIPLASLEDIARVLQVSVAELLS